MVYLEDRSICMQMDRHVQKYLKLCGNIGI